MVRGSPPPRPAPPASPFPYPHRISLAPRMGQFLGVARDPFGGWFPTLTMGHSMGTWRRQAFGGTIPMGVMGVAWTFMDGQNRNQTALGTDRSLPSVIPTRDSRISDAPAAGWQHWIPASTTVYSVPSPYGSPAICQLCYT
jgi:hypothetical protein